MPVPRTKVIHPSYSEQLRSERRSHPLGLKRVVMSRSNVEKNVADMRKYWDYVEPYKREAHSCITFPSLTATFVVLWQVEHVERSPRIQSR